MKKAIKILVADENATERQALCNELRRAGFTNLLEAGNGEEALIQIGKNHPDIAIVDVWLSKLDGIGVLRNTQSLKFAPDKPPAFIVVSMVSKQSIFIEAANAGADLCLLKPYNVESLCKHITSRRAATARQSPSPRLRKHPIWRRRSPRSYIRSAFPHISRAISISAPRYFWQ